MLFSSRILRAAILLAVLSRIGGAEAEETKPWRAWIEPEFPFFSTVVDARAGADDNNPTSNNLTPRALVFPLGEGYFLAYDVDLLRVAVAWKAEDVPFRGAGMAVNSYPYGGDKVGSGANEAPKPNGHVLFRNGLYAGVGTGEPSFSDPRPKLPPEQQVVRGGTDPKQARFRGVHSSEQAVIEYEIGGTIGVEERFALEREGLVRHLKISPHRQPLYIVVAAHADSNDISCRGEADLESRNGHLVCRVAPSETEHSVSIIFPIDGLALPKRAARQGKRWPQSVQLPLPQASDKNVLNLEAIPLPLENPWQRAVRAAAVEFFDDGRAAVVTYDGDVWITDGLRPDGTTVTWTRFTSGLHEPLSLGIRQGELFVFDRNGLWCLHDRDQNGEADYHELFCSQIDQTAETREFASAMKIAKDGRFIVCKPGQQGTFGSILRVSPDGEEVRLMAHGFRQPLLGYDPDTDQIAASDQQGNWVPTTPVHFVEQDAFYGFPNTPEDHQRSITPPLTWIPHQVCASSTSIVWTRNAKLGPLNDQAVLLSYHQPKLLLVHTDIDDEARQGGVTPLDLTLTAPLLNGAINPADGLLYVAGFKIWGTSAQAPTFLGRLRVNPQKSWTMPTRVRAAKRGILLEFDVPLVAESLLQPGSLRVRRWNYKRSERYGSGQYKLDGETGTETLSISSLKLSDDQRAVFLGIPDMQTVMQIEVSYQLTAQDGTPIKHDTYLTAHALRSLDLGEHGFSDNKVDLSRKNIASTEEPVLEPTILRGAAYYKQLGCNGCHSVDGGIEGKNGPSWLRLYGSRRKLLESGKVITADEAYLRESILDPAAKVAEGAVHGEAGMPSYAGVLNDEQIDSLVLFIKALADEDSQAGQWVNLADAASTPSEHPWKVDDFREELARPLRGRSATNGKLTFLGAACFSCHQLGHSQGGRIGPDLTKLDAKMRGAELLRHILEPSLRVEDQYQSRTITTVRGQVHTGFVVAETDREIHLTADPLAEAARVVIVKSEIDEQHLSPVSSMPPDLLNRFTKQQVLDLLAYIEARGDSDHPAFRPAGDE